MKAAPMTMKNEKESNRFGRFATVNSPRLCCPANWSIAGKRTEIITGKTKIEYQMFFC
jgi:hypothetical protein